MDDVLVIACQHILGTTLDMFEVFFEKGLKPQNVFLLGKCYSTNSKVYDRMKRRGLNVSPYSKKYDSTLSFDEQFQKYIEAFWNDITKKVNLNGYKRVVILDDGGYLLLYANDFLSNHENVVGVEQTSSGFHNIKNSNINFPIVNVARSKAKLKLEAPLIAKIAYNQLKKHLSKKDSILVVGQGAIGKSMYELLNNKYNTEKYDLVSHKQIFPGPYSKKLKSFSVIIGSTGQTIINPGDFVNLQAGVILVSVSSSDREFSAAYLRRLQKKNSNCHKDIKVKSITILNSGFPVNFQGGEHSLPPKQAYLTRSLLVAGVLQALTQRGKGLKELNPKTQLKIARGFK
jgi:S-adenosylhomocysteine hydrolase